MEDVGQRETVLFGEGDVDAVVCSGSLQLEVKAATKAFAQGEAEGFIDAAAEGGMEDELHATAIVEKTLGNESGFRGDGSEDGPTGDDVGDQLLRTGFADTAFLHKPCDGGIDFGVGLGDVARADVRSTA